MNQRNDRGHALPDWNELCRRYLEAVAAVNTAGSGPQDNPWQQSLNFWTRPPASWAASASMQPGAVPQMEAFGPLAALMGNFMSQMAVAGASSDWEARLRTALDGFKSQAASAAGRPWPPASQPAGPGSGNAAGWPPWLASPHPELRAKIQEGLRLWSEYQERLQAYQAEMACIAGRAFDLLGERILEAAQEDRVFDNMRAIYDLWVECSEAAYAERVATEEHARCFAGLVNALSAFLVNAKTVSAGSEREAAPDLAADVSELREQQAGMQQALDESRAQRAHDAEVIEALRLELEQLKQKLLP